MDDDVGYYILRVTRDQPWQRFNIGNLLFNTILASVRVGNWHPDRRFREDLEGRPGARLHLQLAREFSVKAGRQVVKDYVAFPALTSLSPAATYKSTLKANAVANVIRNIWANAVIFCGHFLMAQRNSRRPT